MTVIKLYKWTTGSGEVIVSPHAPTDYPYSTDYIRLIADANKILVKGDIRAHCIDIIETDISEWDEQDVVQSSENQ